MPAVFALMFGFLAFRSRIHGVYFAIITQASGAHAWLVFNRNETNLGGTNGLTDFKHILGFRLSEPGTQLVLYVLTVLCLGGAYLLCRWIIASRAGRVLIAIRDSESESSFPATRRPTTNCSSLWCRRRWPAWQACCMSLKSASSPRRKLGCFRRLKW